MRSYIVTYWTGAQEFVRAYHLHDAYSRVGYIAGDGTHLWDETGEVTNEDGNLCCTIKLAVAANY